MAASPSATPGSTFRLNVTALVRAGGSDATLARVRVPWGPGEGLPSGGRLDAQRAGAGGRRPSPSRRLPRSRSLTGSRLPADEGPLRRPRAARRDPPRRRGARRGASTSRWAGRRSTFDVPVLFRRTDPVKGEEIRPFVVEPPVDAGARGGRRPPPRRPAAARARHGPRGGGAVDARRPAAADAGHRRGRDGRGLRGRCGRGDAGRRNGAARPPGAGGASSRRAGPSRSSAGRARPSSSRSTRPRSPASLTLRAEADGRGRTLEPRTSRRIDYPHLPPLTYFPAAEARVVHVDLATDAARGSATSPGPATRCPAVLRQMGFAVDAPRRPTTSSAATSARFDAVVLGIRAANTRRRAEGGAAAPLRVGGEGRDARRPVQHELRAASPTQLGPYPLKLGARPRDGRGGARHAPRAREPAPDDARTGSGRPTSRGGSRSAASTSRRRWDDALHAAPRDGATRARRRRAGSLLVARHGQGDVRLHRSLVLPAAPGGRSGSDPPLREPRRRAADGVTERARGGEEPPPVGRRWGVLYAVVLGALALEIVLFWLFARAFR